MPISPTVNAWMAQNQQQPMDSGDMFKSAFQDHAFNALRAKASSILPYAVTFKVFDADVDQGNAFGAFAVSYGNELVYIPVVMTDGSVTSCEMVYLREEDRFVPLSEKYINDIVNKNTSVTGTTMTKDVRVEDTRNMFRNLIRPPASSNVVLASGRMDVADLPDSAKAKVADYLNSNPQLLKKIGEYYPIRVLGEKLAAAAPAPAPASNTKTQRAAQKTHFKTTTTTTTTTDTEASGVRELNDIPPQEVAKLPPSDKQQLKKHGWLLKDAAETAETFGAELENNFEEFTPHGYKDASVIYAEVLCFGDSSFYTKPALFMGSTILTKDGTHFSSKKVVVSKQRPANEGDLRLFGFAKAHDTKYSSKGTLLVCVPKRGGGWEKAQCPRYFSSRHPFVCTKLDNDDYKFGSADNPILVTDAIKFGSVVSARGSCLVPKKSLFKFVATGEDNPTHFVTSMQVLYDIIRGRGLTLKVKKSGTGIDITNTKTQRTKSFATEGKAAAYLNDEFNLSTPQIIDTLNRPVTFVLSKFAAMAMQQPAPQQQPQPQPQQPQQQQQQIMPQGNTSVPAQPFNPSAINSFAAMGDPDMLDAGILTSFAGDPDVKALLVDYLPDFINILDRIGRVILLFNVKRKEMEQYYRIDRINELLQNCRKIFKMVGDLVPDLQLYINMA